MPQTGIYNEDGINNIQLRILKMENPMARGCIYGTFLDTLHPGRVGSKHETETKEAKRKQNQNSPAIMLACVRP